VKLRKYSDYEKVRPDLLQGGAQYVHVKWPDILVVSAGQENNIDVI
jgi:hypothetical protein